MKNTTRNSAASLFPLARDGSFMAAATTSHVSISATLLLSAGLARDFLGGKAAGRYGVTHPSSGTGLP